jgi:hypothetical protein
MRLTLKINISHTRITGVSHAKTEKCASIGSHESQFWHMDHSSQIPGSILHVQKDTSEIICPQAFCKFKTNFTNLVKNRNLMDNNKQQSSHTDTERQSKTVNWKHHHCNVSVNKPDINRSDLYRFTVMPMETLCKKL